MSRLSRRFTLFFFLPLLAATHVVLAQQAAVYDAPLVRQAYSADHRFLVKVISVPSQIHMEEYFSLRLAVYDGNDPRHSLTNAQIQVAAGMTHGMTHGFAHEMQSSPRVEVRNGTATVSGLYFHMEGEWTLQVTVREGGHEATVSFPFSCCKQ